MNGHHANQLDIGIGGTDDEGNPIMEKQTVGTGKYKTKIVHHKDLISPEKTKKVWVVDEKGHYEYEKGWRDGDFKYKP